MASSSDYSDCVAHLSQSYGNDQKVIAVVGRTGGYSPGAVHEIEVLLRWQTTANNSRGYEFNFAVDGSYAQFVVWHGPHGAGNFDILDEATISAPADGDVIECTIVGTVATCKFKGSTIYTYDTASDGTKWSDGHPGIGFFPVSGATLASYGWKSFESSTL